MKNEVSHLLRLKAIDLGGAVTYSEMLNIRSGCASGKSESYVFPSPASTVLNLRVNDRSLLNTEANVFDMNGKKIMSIRVSSSQVKMNVGFLVPGIYLIKLTDGTSMKFVKQ
jgi:hypothetical protein